MPLFTYITIDSNFMTGVWTVMGNLWTDMGLLVQAVLGILFFATVISVVLWVVRK